MDEGALRRRLAELRLAPPPDLVALYGLHDGVDEDAWNRDSAGAWYPLLVRDGVRFASSAAAAEACRELRADAAGIASAPWWDLGEGELWRPGWFPVFPLTRADENVALDCDPDSPDFGSLWVVRWEATQERRVADSLPEFLDALADRFEAVGTRWDEETRRLVDDEELRAHAASFP